MKSSIVCAYIHDTKCQHASYFSYIPSVNFLNDGIQAWKTHGIDFAGLVHSHPCGQESLSIGDLSYANLLFDQNPELLYAYFPIICGDRLIAFRIEKSDTGLIVIPEKCQIIETID